MDAYLAGLERPGPTAARPRPGIASVASFFVSRVDTEIDKRLDKLGSEERQVAARARPRSPTPGWPTRRYEEVFSGDRWQALEAKGAVPQRPLWASTGVKNPAYSDTMYISRADRARARSTRCRRRRWRRYADHGSSAATPVQQVLRRGRSGACSRSPTPASTSTTSFRVARGRGREEVRRLLGRADRERADRARGRRRRRSCRRRRQPLATARPRGPGHCTVTDRRRGPCLPTRGLDR